MKLKHVFMLAATAVLSAAAFFGCNSEGKSGVADAPAKTAAKTKPLVVYWSWSETKNTKTVAEMLQQKTGADIAVIEMVTPYPTDFGSVMQLGQRDLAQPKAPAIKDMNLDISKYDPIYVGTPIWFSTFAPPVRTFLQSYDFKGKTVALFCTHGQGHVQVPRRRESRGPGDQLFRGGLRVQGRRCRERRSRPRRLAGKSLREVNRTTLF